MDRFPIIIVAGAALLGWVAGEMAISDPAIAGWTAERHALHTVVPALGAMFVVALGKWLASRREHRREQLQAASKKQAAV
jgi:predicted tellurium resistance membrane protein TerC